MLLQLPATTHIPTGAHMQCYYTHSDWCTHAVLCSAPPPPPPLQVTDTVFPMFKAYIEPDLKVGKGGPLVMRVPMLVMHSCRRPC